ncbi:MAG: hypothetical protein HZY76_05920 [Anaerolineae bacterium]|nr:MAG: hypothetical protein HZY76_05920 [Anaerolineae bacterium]
MEQIEGKVLRIVQALHGILEPNTLELTEAVYFQVKEMLDEAAAGCGSRSFSQRARPPLRARPSDTMGER